jgi:hypothetical protein
MKRMLFLALGFLVAVPPAGALPRFASKTGARCQSCHVNPSGAGMRAPFGVRYGRERLPVSEWSEDFEIEDLTNLVTNILGAGADVRTLYYYRQLPDSARPSNSNALWQMQGDIYLNFRVAKKVSVYFEKGLYSGFEVFGLLTFLPAGGHIKVGKFTPNFGTRLDDHTTYIRGVTGFSPEGGRPEHTGIEVGFAPGPITLTGGFYNSQDGFGAGTGNGKAVLGRVDWMANLGKDVSLSLGANVFTKQEPGDGRSTLLGGLGAFSAGDLTVFGEADLVRTTAGGATSTGIVTYVEADYAVVQGVDVKVAFDYFDPDKDHQTGSYNRYSIGLEFFPISGVEVRPMYRLVREKPVEVRNDEIHLFVHFYI